MDELAERLLALPPRFGGAGFTRGDRVSDAAFFAAFALEWSHVLRLFPEVVTARALTDAVSGVGRLGAVKLARERLQSESVRVQVMLAGIADDGMLPAGVVRTPVEIPTLDDVRQGPVKGLQKRLASISATLDSLQLRELAMRGDERTRAWYHSVASPDSVANDFWRVIPSYQSVQVSPAHFPIAARMHLLQHQPVLAAIRSCRKCQQEVDQEGMHFMQCRPRKDMGLGDPFSAVHDALVREVVPALRKVYPGAGVVDVEKQCRNVKHRPDVTVTNHDGQGGKLLVEVSVIRPMGRDHLGRAAVGEALASHESKRRADYATLPAGTTMVPFVCDILGGMGPETAGFVRRLAAVMRDRREVEQAGAPTWEELLKRGVSMVLAKSRARVLHLRAGAEQEDGRP